MKELHFNKRIGDQKGRLMGPDLFNEQYFVAYQEWDEKAGRTTLYLEILRGA